MNWITAALIAVVAIAIGAYLFLSAPAPMDGAPDTGAQEAPATAPVE